MNTVYDSIPDSLLYAGCIQTLRTLTVDTCISTVNVNQLMRALPDTLEVLSIQMMKAKDPSHILLHIPPRLHTMNIAQGFAISAATFDAMPSTLRVVRWCGLTGVHCHSSDLCRWPSRIERVYVSCTTGVRASPQYVHCVKDFQHWWDSSHWLRYATINYKTSDGAAVKYSRYNNQP